MLYAPDYVINGGGVINVYGELHRWPAERSQKKAEEIYDTSFGSSRSRRRKDPDLSGRRPPRRAADRGDGGARQDVDGTSAVGRFRNTLYSFP